MSFLVLLLLTVSSFSFILPLPPSTTTPCSTLTNCDSCSARLDCQPCGTSCVDRSTLCEPTTVLASLASDTNVLLDPPVEFDVDGIPVNGTFIDGTAVVWQGEVVGDSVQPVLLLDDTLWNGTIGSSVTINSQADVYFMSTVNITLPTVTITQLGSGDLVFVGPVILGIDTSLTVIALNGASIILAGPIESHNAAQAGGEVSFTSTLGELRVDGGVVRHRDVSLAGDTAVTLARCGVVATGTCAASDQACPSAYAGSHGGAAHDAGGWGSVFESEVDDAGGSWTGIPGQRLCGCPALEGSAPGGGFVRIASEAAFTLAEEGFIAANGANGDAGTPGGGGGAGGTVEVWAASFLGNGSLSAFGGSGVPSVDGFVTLDTYSIADGRTVTVVGDGAAGVGGGGGRIRLRAFAADAPDPNELAARYRVGMSGGFGPPPIELWEDEAALPSGDLTVTRSALGGAGTLGVVTHPAVPNGVSIRALLAAGAEDLTTPITRVLVRVPSGSQYALLRRGLFPDAMTMNAGSWVPLREEATFNVSAPVDVISDGFFVLGVCDRPLDLRSLRLNADEVDAAAGAADYAQVSEIMRALLPEAPPKSRLGCVPCDAAGWASDSWWRECSADPANVAVRLAGGGSLVAGEVVSAAGSVSITVGDDGDVLVERIEAAADVAVEVNSGALSITRGLGGGGDTAVTLSAKDTVILGGAIASIDTVSITSTGADVVLLLRNASSSTAVREFRVTAETDLVVSNGSAVTVSEAAHLLAVAGSVLVEEGTVLNASSSVAADCLSLAAGNDGRAGLLNITALAGDLRVAGTLVAVPGGTVEVSGANVSSSDTALIDVSTDGTLRIFNEAGGVPCALQVVLDDDVMSGNGTMTMNGTESVNTCPGRVCVVPGGDSNCDKQYPPTLGVMPVSCDAGAGASLPPLELRRVAPGNCLLVPWLVREDMVLPQAVGSFEVRLNMTEEGLSLPDAGTLKLELSLGATPSLSPYVYTSANADIPVFFASSLIAPTSFGARYDLLAPASQSVLVRNVGSSTARLETIPTWSLVDCLPHHYQPPASDISVADGDHCTSMQTDLCWPCPFGYEAPEGSNGQCADGVCGEGTFMTHHFYLLQLDVLTKQYLLPSDVNSTAKSTLNQTTVVLGDSSALPAVAAQLERDPLSFWKIREGAQEVTRSCLSCDWAEEGLQCPGGSELPQILPGYWGERTSSGFVEFNMKIVRCISEDVCPGGPPAACSDQREGTACFRCAPGHFPLRGDCLECPPDAKERFVIFCLLLCVCLIFIAYLGERMPGRPLIMSMVTHLQVISIFFQIRLKWSRSVLGIFLYLDFFNLSVDPSAPECIFGSSNIYLIKWIMTMMIPFGCGALAIAVRYLCVCSGRIRRFAFQAYFQLVLLAYLLLGRRAFEPYDCTDISGSPTMDAWPEYECSPDDSRWMTLALAAIAPIVLYVIGLPVVLSRILRNGDLEDERFYKKWHFLYDTYRWRDRRLFAYWRIISVARKFFIIIFVLFTSRFPILQAFLVLLAVSVGVLLHGIFRPADDWKMNALELFNQVSEIMILFAGLAMEGATGAVGVTSDSVTVSVLNGLIFVLLGASVLLFLVFMAMEFRDRRRRRKALREAGVAEDDVADAEMMVDKNDIQAMASHRVAANGAFVCAVCGKDYVQRWDLHIHMQLRHDSTLGRAKPVPSTVLAAAAKVRRTPVRPAGKPTKVVKRRSRSNSGASSGKNSRASSRP